MILYFLHNSDKIRLNSSLNVMRFCPGGLYTEPKIKFGPFFEGDTRISYHIHPRPNTFTDLCVINFFLSLLPELGVICIVVVFSTASVVVASVILLFITSI